MLRNGNLDSIGTIAYAGMDFLHGTGNFQEFDSHEHQGQLPWKWFYLIF